MASSTPSRPRPTYAYSQTGSESFSQRLPDPFHHRDHPRQHSRAPSASSTVSSQNTLVPGSRSVAGYPATSQLSAGAAPSAYKAPSAASTSAARTRHGRRTSSSPRRSREIEHDVSNVFPWFGQTGDVEICLRDRSGRTEKRYLLHRLILSQNCKWFREDVARAEKKSTKHNSVGSNGLLIGSGSNLSYNPAASQLSIATASLPARLYYELDWTRFVADQGRIPALARVDQGYAAAHGGPPILANSTKPALPSASFFRNLSSNGSSSVRTQPVEQSEHADVLTAYDNLFLSFYNHAPLLSTDNIATAYVDSKLLISIASLYGAIDATGPRIDYHLLQFGSRLWKQIAKYPPSYLKLGYLARSRAIFSEALVHVVGAWPAGQAQLRRGIPGVEDAVVELIEDKVDELEEVKLRTGVKLFRINLTTGRGERVSPSNAYVDWLALSLFRQWVADSTASAQTGILKDNVSRESGGRSQSATPVKFVKAYRLMAEGGQAYLNHDDCKRFLKLRPEDYSRDNLRRFERRIEEMKNLARDAVRPLTRNSLQLDMSQGQLPYLTCVRCEDRDFGYVWNIS